MQGPSAFGAVSAARVCAASVFRHQDGVPALAHTGRDRPTHEAFAALDAFELIVLELDRIVTALIDNRCLQTNRDSRSESLT